MYLDLFKNRTRAFWITVISCVLLGVLLLTIVVSLCTRVKVLKKSKEMHKIELEKQIISKLIKEKLQKIQMGEPPDLEKPAEGSIGDTQKDLLQPKEEEEEDIIELFYPEELDFTKIKGGSKKILDPNLDYNTAQNRKAKPKAAEENPRKRVNKYVQKKDSGWDDEF